MIASVVTLPLVASVGYGVGDFCGGVSAQKTPVLGVAAGASGCAMLLLGATSLVVQPTLTSAGAAWSVAAGFVAPVAICLLYAALAGGSMSLTAPIAACGTALPVAVSLAQGARVTSVAAVGLVLILAGVVTAATPMRDAARFVRLSRRSLVLALGAAAAIGVGLTCIQRASATPGTSGLAVASLSRTVSFMVLSAVLFATRSRRARLSRTGLPLILAAGAGDGTANALFAVASQHHQYAAVVVVVSALYPVWTVILAWLKQGERMSLPQAAGAGCALAGVALVAVT